LKLGLDNRSSYGNICKVCKPFPNVTAKPMNSSNHIQQPLKLPSRTLGSSRTPG